MKKNYNLVFALVAVAVAGCGGGGGNGSLNNPNPFTGSYGGTLQASDGSTVTMNLTIAADGSATGSEMIGSATTADSGTVDLNGNFTFRSRLAGTRDAILKGQLGFANNGDLVGDGTETQGSQSETITFDLRGQ